MHASTNSAPENSHGRLKAAASVQAFPTLPTRDMAGLAPRQDAVRLVSILPRRCRSEIAGATLNYAGRPFRALMALEGAPQEQPPPPGWPANSPGQPSHPPSLQPRPSPPTQNPGRLRAPPAQEYKGGAGSPIFSSSIPAQSSASLSRIRALHLQQISRKSVVVNSPRGW